MDWKPILSCIGDWPCNFLVFNNFILSLLIFYPSQFQTIPHWITSIVLKPDPVINSVGWSGHGSDGLTRVNQKKKLCLIFSSFWDVPQTTGFLSSFEFDAWFLPCFGARARERWRRSRHVPSRTTMPGNHRWCGRLVPKQN
jgi:hypothetical protein